MTDRSIVPECRYRSIRADGADSHALQNAAPSTPAVSFKKPKDAGSQSLEA